MGRRYPLLAASVALAALLVGATVTIFIERPASFIEAVTLTVTIASAAVLPPAIITHWAGPAWLWASSRGVLFIFGAVPNSVAVGGLLPPGTAQLVVSGIVFAGTAGFGVLVLLMPERARVRLPQAGKEAVTAP